MGLTPAFPPQKTQILARSFMQKSSFAHDSTNRCLNCTRCAGILAALRALGANTRLGGFFGLAQALAKGRITDSFFGHNASNIAMWGHIKSGVIDRHID